jgi:hypothetical protein
MFLYFDPFRIERMMNHEYAHDHVFSPVEPVVASQVECVRQLRLRVETNEPHDNCMA